MKNQASKIKTAVIGVGYLGKFHANKYARLPQSQLTAVCDIDQEKCAALAKQLKTEPFFEYSALIGKIDAVSIAVPTPLHCAIGCFFLEQGIHVLIEKPIATTIQEANRLIAAAKHNQVLLQVGHLERFNCAVKAIEPSLSHPRFIESCRLAPFKLRGTDVSVILDLMIHDIDIIQSIVKSEVKKISANGASVLSSDIDIANARLEFANGCVANVTASRVSTKTERKLRIFQDDTYISIDMNNKEIAIHQKEPQDPLSNIPNVKSHIRRFDQSDSLQDQLSAFLDAIIYNQAPIVSGKDGKQALKTALRISSIVQRSNKKYWPKTTLS